MHTQPPHNESGLPAPSAMPPAAAPTQDEKTMALLVHFGQIVIGFLAPLIIYLMKKDESKYVAFHSLQALYFSLAAFVIMMVVSAVTCGMGALIIPVAWVFNVIAGLKVLDGKYFEYPVVGKLAREQLYGK